MGLFGGGNSKTKNSTDSRAFVDNSVVDFGIGGGNSFQGGNTFGDIKTGGGGNINVTTTDHGALQSASVIAGSAFDSIDRSVDSLGAGFNSALSSVNKATSSSIEALKESFSSDTKSITKDAIMWGSFIAIGYLALKMKG